MDENGIREALDILCKEGKKEEKMKKSRKSLGKKLLFVGMIFSSFMIFYGLYTLSSRPFAGLLFFALGGVQYFRCLADISR